jgi:YVTN family beta-propeller protein
MSKHIFVSYSKKDSDFAWKLADDLEKRGFKTWIDRAISGGEEWRQSIERALQEAGEVIVVLSPNAVSSDWVMHEGSVAYGLGKTLYPVLMAPVDKLPIWVEKFQYTNFVGVDYDTALEELVAALTPPNPLQDLLEQQMAAYQEHGELLGEALLRVFEEKRDRLTLNSKAEELLEKSKQAVAYREKLVQDAAYYEKQVEKSKQTLRRLRWGSLVVVAILVVASAVSLIGAFRALKSIEARSAIAADQLARLFEQTGTVSVGGEPSALAWDGTSLWVTNGGDDTVQQIDPEAGAVVATLPVGSCPVALAWDGVGLWVANLGEGAVQQIDPEAGAVVATVDVDSGSIALAWDGANLWVASRSDNTVQQIDPEAGAVVATLRVGENPYALAWDGASLWVANRYDNTVMQIDPYVVNLIVAARRASASEGE